MAVIGDVSKGVLLVFCFWYILVMIGVAVSGNIALSLFMLAGLVIPGSWLAYEYVKYKRNKNKAATTSNLDKAKA